MRHGEYIPKKINPDCPLSDHGLIEVSPEGITTTELEEKTGRSGRSFPMPRKQERSGR